MGNSQRDLRQILKLSLASLSLISCCGLVPRSAAQQLSSGFADASTLPEYYSGSGQITVAGVTESEPAAPATQPFGLVSTQIATADKFTVQATVVPGQPNQVKVVVQQAPPSTGQQVAGEAPRIEANADSQFQRPRVFERQGMPLPPKVIADHLNLEQPRRDRQDRAGLPPNPERPREERREPGQHADSRGPDFTGPDSRGPGDHGPARESGPNQPRPQMPHFQRQTFGFPPQGPRMPGGMPGGMSQGPHSAMPGGPGWDPKAMGGELDTVERIFNSPVVRQFMQLKEENLQLKAELKLQQHELQAKMELTELRLRMHMEEAEKRVHEAHQQLNELKHRPGFEQPAADHETDRTHAERAEREERLRDRMRAMEKEKQGRRESDRESDREGDSEGSPALRELADLRKEVERLKEERKAAFAELEKMASRSVDMERKLEAVARERMNFEQQLIEAKRAFAKELDAAANRAETKPDSDRREKSGDRKKTDDDDDDDVEDEDEDEDE